MKFPAPAVRFVRPTDRPTDRPTARAPARLLARSFGKNYFVKSLKSPLPLLLSLPLLLQSYYRGRAGRDHIMRGDRICELRLVSETFHWHIQRVASYPVGTVCRYTLRDQPQANSASWFMQFMQCAMYADKPSSSLETEQFRFRFEMAVDRTHSRAFICRRRRRRTPRPTQFRGSDQEGARAQMAPSERSKIVKNTSFMQSIHADRTRISENRRASSEGVRSFETPFKGRMDALFPRLASFESCGQGCCINT